MRINGKLFTFIPVLSRGGTLPERAGERGRVMESPGASPETALELIERIGRDVTRAAALVDAAVAAGEPEAWRSVLDPEEWRAALANAMDGLLEASAALRAQEVPFGGYALARIAGYRQRAEEERRERQARPAHLALVRRAAG